MDMFENLCPPGHVTVLFSADNVIMMEAVEERIRAAEDHGQSVALVCDSASRKDYKRLVKSKRLSVDSTYTLGDGERKLGSVALNPTHDLLVIHAPRIWTLTSETMQLDSVVDELCDLRPVMDTTASVLIALPCRDGEVKGSLTDLAVRLVHNVEPRTKISLHPASDIAAIELSLDG